MGFKRNFVANAVQKTKYHGDFEKQIKCTTDNIINAFTLMREHNKGWSFELKDVKEANVNWDVVETEEYKKEIELITERENSRKALTV